MSSNFHNNIYRLCACNMPFGNSYFVTILVMISNDLYGIYIEKPVHLWETLLSRPGAVWEISIENGKDIKAVDN